MIEKGHAIGAMEKNGSPPGGGQPPAVQLHNGGNPEPKMHHDGSFRRYMEGKIDKLQMQFHQDAEAWNDAVVDPSLRELFKGVSIHVNGYTQPSHLELKRIMAKYGGSFQNYYSKSSVTHIICSKLPDAKVKIFEKERNPTPVVRPEWITDSVQAAKCLPIDLYILWQLKPGGPGQQLLPWGKLESKDCTVKSSFRYEAERLEKAHKIAQHMRASCESLKGPPKSSRDDPNFVQSFYRASRLHFIGTWKSRLDALLESEIVREAPMPLKGQPRSVMHVDMDCFFASVAEASHPEFKGLPLAVCHSNSSTGSGEISSANYEARKYGLHASMFMSEAKSLCPELIVVPYEFEKYERVSEKMYKILFEFSSAVQPVSCDEAFVDITGLGDPWDIAASVRKKINAQTGCCASAGIGPNMLLARIATSKAKPNGQHKLDVEACMKELASLEVEELPGIGWKTGRKLREAGYITVGDIQSSSEASVQGLIGNKAGSIVYNFAFGRDDREVNIPNARKSVGAEVNWGVRFDSTSDAENFLRSIASQISGRLKEMGMRGRSLTLKVKKKRDGWKEPAKFLGMGACDNISKSTSFSNGIDSVAQIHEESLTLLRSLRINFSDIRGLGLALSKLESDTTVHPLDPKQQSILGYTENSKNEGRSIPQHSKSLGNNGTIKQQLSTKPDFSSLFKSKRQTSEKTKYSASNFVSVDPKSIDQNFLQELPLGIRREVEIAYGKFFG